MNPATLKTVAAQRVALVTDGGGHLGGVIALALARQGWRVAIHYRDRTEQANADAVVRAIASGGGRALALQGDLTDPADIRQLLQQAARLGAVGCIVNNAACTVPDTIADFAGATLDAHMRINLTAPLLLMQALHAATPEGAQAVVINLLDQKLWHPTPDFLSYTLSKAALQTATATLALALAPTLRVVGIGADGLLPPADDADDADARIETDNADDIAAAVCYMAAAGGVTGATMLVDSGRSLLPR